MIKLKPTVIRFTDEERAAIDQARGQTPLGEWIRRAISLALETDGFLTELRSKPAGQNEQRPAAIGAPAESRPQAAPELAKPAPLQPAGPVRAVPAADARRLERPHSAASRAALAGLHRRED